MPGGWWVSRVELSRHEKDRAYVSVTGYREDDFRPLVYTSDDRGESWRSISDGLPSSPVNVVREDPSNADVLYVGNEHGAWVSLDRGGSWQELGAGLPSVAVHDLAVHPRDRELVVATHGRGFFVLDVALFAELSADALQARARLYPVTNALQLNSLRSDTRSGERVHRAANPPGGVPIWYSLRDEEQEDAVKLVVLDVAGEEIAELKPALEPGLHRASWDLRARRAAGGENEAGRGRGRRRRSRAQPGTYRIVLEVGEERFEQKFEVEADPISSGR